MKKENLPDESLWVRTPSGLYSLIVAVVVSILGIVLDQILVKEGLGRRDLMILSNSLTGLFAGWLFYQMAREARASRELIRARMKTIAELNHHIRNALQVIKFLGGRQQSGMDAMQLQLINDSVDRIEWALREVLPRYPLDGGSAAAAAADTNGKAVEAISKAIGPAA